MALFRYKALSTAGETLEGQMEAGSADEVVVRLQEQGHLPVEARRADEAGGGASLSGLMRRRELDEAQVLQFTQQLATLLGAGQPLDRALGILLELPDTVQARRVIERVREAVRGGAPLSTALEQQHGLFPRLYVNLVRAGEAGGNVHEALRRLADYLERSARLRGRVVNALIYPVILVVMIIVSVGFLMAVVVPQFQQLFDSLNAELPWYSKVVLELGLFTRDWWWLVLAAMVAAGLLLAARLRQPEARRALDARLLRLRFAGDLVARLDTARLARTLGTLVRNGVPLLTALNLSRPVLGNRVLAEAIDVAAEEVKTGSGLGHALGRRKVFPRLAVQMVQVGEESGELDTMLLKVADTFDQETANALDRLMAALVPALTVLMTAVVAVIILSVLLPIYDLTNSIG
ncbi:type II secretion system F family protein [Arenimonas caeni]|jgi:general secretion pathway protein F|uniref:Type II secretion system protein GspF n=1 Tax=Arenimonas caeni TaxID=2058085 RepID=A0A2P6MC31_9GAMM|nr:type II secretion system F family protein [Arenimonas caeni]MDY0022084.1 type II secretion system F family protein [Arenimonas caeni]PRH83547.1 type II secretion system protein GspF [Arenimonas caeni]